MEDVNQDSISSSSFFLDGLGSIKAFNSVTLGWWPVSELRHNPRMPPMSFLSFTASSLASPVLDNSSVTFSSLPLKSMSTYKKYPEGTWADEPIFQNLCLQQNWTPPCLKVTWNPVVVQETMSMKQFHQTTPWETGGKWLCPGYGSALDECRRSWPHSRLLRGEPTCSPAWRFCLHAIGHSESAGPECTRWYYSYSCSTTNLMEFLIQGGAGKA